MLCQEQEFLLFFNGPAALYCNVALNSAGQGVAWCVSLIILPDQLADTCWKGAKAPFFVPNVNTEHGNIRGSVDSLCPPGCAAAVLVSCVEGELQSSASPTFTL